MNQFEILLLEKRILFPPKKFFYEAYLIIKELENLEEILGKIDIEHQKMLSILNPKLFVGQIGNVDKFFSNSLDKEFLLKTLPDVLFICLVCVFYNNPAV